MYESLMLQYHGSRLTGSQRVNDVRSPEPKSHFAQCHKVNTAPLHLVDHFVDILWSTQPHFVDVHLVDPLTSKTVISRATHLITSSLIMIRKTFRENLVQSGSPRFRILFKEGICNKILKVTAFHAQETRKSQ